jgi:UDP-N-acetylmuramoyl-tripeptide--D-alanyl-D-alanine ligase
MRKFYQLLNFIFPFFEFITLLQDTQDYNYPIYLKRLFSDKYGYILKRNFIDFEEINFSMRNILTFIISLGIFLGLTLFVYMGNLTLILKILLLILLILSIPILIAIGNIPTLIFRLYYIYLIYKAKRKINDDGTKIIAITGSTGKTSTREMLVKILSTQGEVLSTKKNYNSLWGNSLVLSNYNHEDYIVLEFAMDSPGHVGVQARTIKPDLGAILNIGDVHAENIGSIEKIYYGKKELADYLLKNDKLVVLNEDDVWLKKAVKEGNPNIITHGFQSDEYKLLETKTTSKGLQFSFIYTGKKYDVDIPVFGNEFAYNALTAIILAKLVGVKIEDSISALKKYETFSGRFEINEFNNTTVVNDAYNANPTSMKMALETFNNIFPSDKYKRVAILGDMKELGDVAIQKHKEISELVKKLKFDDVYYIGDYYKQFPFSKELSNWEEAKEIVDELISGDKKTAVLLKASNSIGLHKILTD